MAMDSKVMSLERSKAKGNNMHGQPISILKEKYHSFPISSCGQVSSLSMPPYVQLTPRGGIMEKLLENSHVVFMGSFIICFKIWFDFLIRRRTSVWLDYRQTGLSTWCSSGLLLACKRLKLNHVHFAGHVTLYCA